jgi:F-type H+-transporting ATPase subunit b
LSVVVQWDTHEHQLDPADAGVHFRHLHLALREVHLAAADARDRGEEGRQSLSRAEKRIAEMLTEAKTRASDIVAQGEKLKTETIDQARSEANTEGERIIVAAKAEIQQEVSRAKEALRNQVADLAVAGARQILKREVDAKAHAELLAALQKQL